MELFDYEKQHLQTLRSHLAECTVLLRSNGAFPLAQPGKIAAYGNGVRKTVKGGTGSGEVNSRYFVTVEQGLKNAGFTLTTESWLEGYTQMYAQARKTFLAEMKAEAKARHANAMLYAMGKVMPEPEYQLPLDGEGDAAIYVLARNSGEGNDRDPIAGDILLTQTEIRDILELNRKFDKFMLVINAGGAVDLSPLDQVGNILILSQLGVETGDALADILLGKQNPSGKLATTWSAWQDYADMGTFGDHNDTYYNEGIYVGYRYFDSVGKKALFPFGYGLSYTTFRTRMQDVTLTGSQVTLRAVVTNTGKYAGKEVVQVYVSAPQGKLGKPFQDLAAFAKTPSLEPSQERVLTLQFDMKDLASFDEGRCVYILEPGSYVVRLGSSSVDTVPVALVEVPEEVLVTQVKKCFGDPGFADWKPESIPAQALPQELPRLTLESTAISCRNVDYSRAYPIADAVKGLSDEDLAYANVGAFDPKAGALSIIGNASSHVAGAAGECTSKLLGAGLNPLILADGPAGLRLAPRFYRDEKGAHGLGQSGLPASVVESMPKALQLLIKLLSSKSKAPKGTREEYQYCTAIPIGTALAQSWNLELAKACGDIVGDEMERFGVHLWLAPAMNIHRSIRCGRNFEYFSEDPLISGKMAAAITQGVQAHPGCGTTIKHYAVNNQEINRYGNNSHVSPRALREIYQKGFGICVRESQPHAVMTSYNLLNGQHTAESRDLCDAVLRREYGFQGIIMTDWVVGGGIMNSKEDIHPAVQPHLVAAAGGDLFMPGCKGDYEDILKGLKAGTLSREQLEINATRVYEMGKKLAER